MWIKFLPCLICALGAGCTQSWGTFWQTEGANVQKASSVIDNTGKAVWAVSTAVAPNNSVFRATAVDTTGSVLVAGYQDNNGNFTYAGQSINGPSSSTNSMLIKFLPNGNAVWARGLTGGNYAQFFSLTTDSANNIFAAGVQTTGVHDYSGQTATGTASNNVALVKYDANGNALWAQSVSAGAAQNYFYGVSTDTNGNVYAAGYQTNTGTYTYSGQSINGVNGSSNATLIKYNASGTGIWARTPTAGAVSEFFGVATDAAGNVYAVGYQSNTGLFDYGGATATGAYAGSNAVLVKFDSTGNALWARTQTTCPNNSVFNSVAVAATGEVYAVGYQDGNGSCTYGATSVAGPYAAGANPIVVKFDSAGNGLWARSSSATTNGGPFSSVSVDSLGNVYAAGKVNTAISYTFGSQTITGTAGGTNPILVKYNAAGTALWARTISGGSVSAEFTGVAIAANGIVYTAGTQSNNGSYSYGSGVSATGAYNSGTNAVIVKYE